MQGFNYGWNIFFKFKTIGNIQNWVVLTIFLKCWGLVKILGIISTNREEKERGQLQNVNWEPPSKSQHLI